MNNVHASRSNFAFNTWTRITAARKSQSASRNCSAVSALATSAVLIALALASPFLPVNHVAQLSVSLLANCAGFFFAFLAVVRVLGLR